MTQQNELPAEDGRGRTKRTKRKASSDETSPRRRTKVSEPGPQNYHEENLCSRLSERNRREDREGQPSRKRKRILYEDVEASSSSSADTSGGKLIVQFFRIL